MPRIPDDYFMLSKKKRGKSVETPEDRIKAKAERLREMYGIGHAGEHKLTTYDGTSSSIKSEKKGAKKKKLVSKVIGNGIDNATTTMESLLDGASPGDVLNVTNTAGGLAFGKCNLSEVDIPPWVYEHDHSFNFYPAKHSKDEEIPAGEKEPTFVPKMEAGFDGNSDTVVRINRERNPVKNFQNEKFRAKTNAGMKFRSDGNVAINSNNVDLSGIRYETEDGEDASHLIKVHPVTGIITVPSGVVVRGDSYANFSGVTINNSDEALVVDNDSNYVINDADFPVPPSYGEDYPAEYVEEDQPIEEDQLRGDYPDSDELLDELLEDNPYYEPREGDEDGSS